MLARCCLTDELDRCLDSDISARMAEQYASECVGAAQQMISTVCHYHTYNTAILPAWWYRMFYTHTAAMVLAVSGLRPDLFPLAETCGPWENAMMLFRAHEHLSESVQICKAALQNIYAKIQQRSGVSTTGPTSEENFILEDFLGLLQDSSFLNGNSFI